MERKTVRLQAAGDGPPDCVGRETEMDSNQSRQDSAESRAHLPGMIKRTCSYCHRLLQRKPGEPHGKFLKRQFCNGRHEKRFHLVGQAKPGDPFLALESREPLRSTPPPGAVRGMDDVENCPKCGSHVLWVDGPFVACLCGVRIPAKDGDWERESWRPLQTSWMDLPRSSAHQARVN